MRGEKLKQEYMAIRNYTFAYVKNTNYIRRLHKATKILFPFVILIY